MKIQMLDCWDSYMSQPDMEIFTKKVKEFGQCSEVIFNLLAYEQDTLIVILSDFELTNQQLTQLYENGSQAIMTGSIITGDNFENLLEVVIKASREFPSVVEYMADSLTLPGEVITILVPERCFELMYRDKRYHVTVECMEDEE